MQSGSSISKCKLVHDPGGKDLNIKDGTSCDDDVPYTADTHLSCDHNETISTASNIKPILEFVQGKLGNHTDPRANDTSSHPTDNIPDILHADARCADVVQSLPLQCPTLATHPSDFDHTRDIIDMHP